MDRFFLSNSIRRFDPLGRYACGDQYDEEDGRLDNTVHLHRRSPVPRSVFCWELARADTEQLFFLCFGFLGLRCLFLYSLAFLDFLFLFGLSFLFFRFLLFRLLFLLDFY